MLHSEDDNQEARSALKQPPAVPGRAAYRVRRSDAGA